MKALNKATLIGNLGEKPEVRTLESGTKVASFSLATNETYKDSEGNAKTETEWHSIVAWGNLAKVAEKYFEKGSKIYLEGKIKTRNYIYKLGQTKYVTEIIADSIIIL